ncbi:MAG: OmpH family outer membrane protein, partial [Elusimicrobiaceae bacterium]|nr:OmpH family outer membrane protein [Elusimicrobiaceae bacterium]
KEAVAYRSILESQRGYEEKLQAQLGLDAGELQKKEKELAEKKDKLSETKFKKEVLALQKEAAVLQQKYQLQAQKILIASQIVAEKLQPAVEETLQDVAEKSGAGVILNKAVVVYPTDKVKSKIDLTDAFIKALNENVKAEEYPNPETIQPAVGGQ